MVIEIEEDEEKIKGKGDKFLWDAVRSLKHLIW